MKPNLKNKIKKVKEDPKQQLSYLDRAKIFLDPYYQTSVDGTAVKQPLVENIKQPEEPKNILTDNLIKAQQWKETGGTFNPKLISKKGAKGLAQIMPNTWNEAIKKGWIHKKADIFDPKDSEQAQRKIMEHLLSTETVNGDIAKALAAYNWGFGNLRKQIDKHGDKWLNEEIPLETRDYIQKITNYQKNLEQQ